MSIRRWLVHALGGHLPDDPPPCRHRFGFWQLVDRRTDQYGSRKLYQERICLEDGCGYIDHDVTTGH